MSAQELADLAAAFNAARETNQTAALNEYVSYTETQTSPDKMLLIDSAEFQAMEMARLCNIPPYLAGISVGIIGRSNDQPEKGGHNADLNEGNKKPASEPRPGLCGGLGLASRVTGFGLGHFSN